MMTPLMHMPKAAMNEDHLFSAWKDDIRPQIFGQYPQVQSIAVPQGKQLLPDDHFRLCVATPNGTHQSGALRLGKSVHESLFTARPDLHLLGSVSSDEPCSRVFSD
jgi:hypothetical protein